jgi:hypothetical protein
MSGAIPPLSHYAFMAWCLVKHGDNFAFTFIRRKSDVHRIRHLTACGLLPDSLHTRKLSLAFCHTKLIASAFP